jgi:hypothetical protein
MSGFAPQLLTVSRFTPHAGVVGAGIFNEDHHEIVLVRVRDALFVYFPLLELTLARAGHRSVLAVRAPPRPLPRQGITHLTHPQTFCILSPVCSGAHRVHPRWQGAWSQQACPHCRCLRAPPSGCHHTHHISSCNFAQQIHITVQERLTREIAHALNDMIGAKGVAVLVESRYTCTASTMPTHLTCMC